MAISQRNRFSLGAELVIPNGNFTNIATTGWGAAFRYELSLNRYFTGIATVEGASFGEKTVTLSPPPYSSVGIWSFSTKTTMIPIQIGAKFNLANIGEEQNLFLTGELGANILMARASLNGSDVPINTETDFCYAVGAGYRVRRFELSYRQQFVTSSGKSINYSCVRLTWLIPRKK